MKTLTIYFTLCSIIKSLQKYRHSLLNYLFYDENSIKNTFVALSFYSNFTTKRFDDESTVECKLKILHEQT